MNWFIFMRRAKGKAFGWLEVKIFTIPIASFIITPQWQDGKLHTGRCKTLGTEKDGWLALDHFLCPLKYYSISLNVLRMSACFNLHYCFVRISEKKIRGENSLNLFSKIPFSSFLPPALSTSLLPSTRCVDSSLASLPLYLSAAVCCWSMFPTVQPQSPNKQKSNGVPVLLRGLTLR